MNEKSELPNFKVVDASEDAVTEGTHVLRAGGLVAFPTETVYGLGADATNERAVALIFTSKSARLSTR